MVETDISAILAGVGEGLKSKQRRDQEEASDELRDRMALITRDKPNEQLREDCDTLCRFLGQLILHGDSNEILGGLLALDRLIDILAGNAAQIVPRFVNYLNKALQSDDVHTLVCASKTLGRLVPQSGFLAKELVKSEVRSALEHIHSANPGSKRLLAAFLTIKELATNAPSLMLPYVVEVFELAWVGLRNCDPLVCATAGGAIGLDSSAIQLIFGSLLLRKELAVHYVILTIEQQKETCEFIFRLSSHRNPRIQAQIITLLPILATHSPLVFAQTYLGPSMTFLKTQLKKGKERDAVFRTIGEMAIAMGDSMSPYLGDITRYVREGLTMKGKGRTHINNASILDCIRMLSLALGPTFSGYAQKLLALMLTCDITNELRDSLQTTAEHIPSLRPCIQTDFLALLERFLLDRDACTDSDTQPPARTTSNDHHIPTHPRDDTFVFALNVLGDFDFGSLPTSAIVQKVMFKYVEHESPEVRKTAALTCCRYFLRDFMLKRPGCKLPRIPPDALRRLLSLGIGDPDANIRGAVLSAFSSEFDGLLAQPDHIRSLFLGTNDEIFHVRIAAMCIIGRLSSINPAYVLPSLRKLLLNLLTGLTFAKAVPEKLETLRMINVFASNSTSLLETYVAPILDVLLPKATDESQAVTTATLNAIANLFKFAGPSARDYGARLMPSLLSSLASLTSNTRREAALEAISQLAQNSGRATSPYIEFPELLPALIKMVKVEEVESIRLSMVRLLGALGALDPVKCPGTNGSTLELHRVNQVLKESKIDSHMRRLDLTDAEVFLSEVFNALMDNVLSQPSLRIFHPSAIDAIVMVCKVTGMQCTSFLEKVIPTFLSVIRASSEDTFGYYFSQLSVLVDVIRQHIRPYLTEIINTIRMFWHNMNQAPLISLIETLSIHMGDEIKRYISNLLLMIIATLERGTSSAAQRILHLLVVLGNTVEEYMHVIVPSLIRVLSGPGYPIKVRKSAIDCITSLSEEVDLSDLSSPVVQSLVDVLSGNEHVLVQASMNCLCALMRLLGQEFMCYTRTVNNALARYHINHDGYSTLLCKLQKGESLPPRLDTNARNERNQIMYERPLMRQRELNINLERLKNAWDTSRVSTTREWQQWVQELTLHLLEESPCATVRACANLAELYHPFAKSLFNTAFASCWAALPEQYQQSLAESLVDALSSPSSSYNITSTVLNLSEFMDRCNMYLPLETRVMSYHAKKSHTYAKALRYEELHFDADQSMSTLETLMAINNNLQQPDSAHGILRTSHELGKSGIKESWLEKLHYWKAALASYVKRERNCESAKDCEDWDIVLGKIRCLHALEDWKALSEIADEKWSRASPEHQRAIAPLAATAAWRLKNWELMQTLFGGIKRGTADRSFFGAVLAVHCDQLEIAAAHIRDAQKKLDPELTIMLDDSYGRSYEVIVRLQMLAELEEIIIYKKSRDSERRRQIHEMWNQRLLGCQRSVEVWQRILNLRTLSGCSVEDDIEIWIKFANMCRKENRLDMAKEAIASVEEAALNLQGPPPKEIKLARLRIDWQLGRRKEAFDGLNTLTRSLEHQLPRGKQSKLSLSEKDKLVGFRSIRKVISKCYRTLADWQTVLHEGEWNLKHIEAVLDAYHTSMQHSKDSYKACHAWALAAYKTARVIGRDPSSKSKMPEGTLRGYIILAIEALFQSISLSSNSPLQDILRILTLWFTHGNEKEVNITVNGGFSLISLDAWLAVSPQLVARITSPSKLVRTTVQRLLTEVAKSHPQALVYPLTVAMKSQVARRSQSACGIISDMRRHSLNLVLQADTISQELIRVAALWHELWHEALEEASRVCFVHGDIEGMINMLRPLHAMMEAGPVTLNEIAFVHSFGRYLAEAKQYCRAYLASRAVGDVNHAWGLYTLVYEGIGTQLPLMLQLKMGSISPKLKSCVNLDIAVPGTYRNHASPVVKVARFDPNLPVIESRKRPRRLKIVGDDGNVYMYLLKGQEDIRQDERVMQLFGLVNTLFAGDSESVRRQLAVQPFQAIPLSQSSGLLGWVSNSDTILSLIKEHREARQIKFNIELSLMLRMSPNYYKLPLLGKIETFQDAMAKTTGKDLYQVLWLKSASSEAWLGHRTHYTRSLAVMSIVGYILGLGDRHPSNLLMHRDTGNIVHVDFGDCFDVALQRDQFPEKVPFRLTRMMVVAMGIGNLEGNFRAACEIVVRVLRTHKDSIMAILEAFLHDPVLTWQMGSQPPDPQSPKSSDLEGLGDLGQFTESPSFRRSSVLGAGVLDPHQGVDKNSAGNEEVLNARAVEVLSRVEHKLTGCDFRRGQMGVEEQVRKLIEEATNIENLCQHYVGWCAFW
ncbi:phosphatidylinositol kinase- protein kinase tor1 [Aspergillus melleus]|uniref:Phosphatidylinositol kinase- protein kinase tor1 n=1 Tax=Aspergillus melleus TaxID=138277 RepID=A0ACC3AX37_9EURO|nr:phosphatidylinositol kinase- protein kinase tor1 [Aspergillus melleus]